MIRLIVTDLDGTLLIHRSTIHPDNLAALREAADLGVHFAAASGRRVENISLLMRQYGLDSAHLIGCNGSQIAELPGAAPFCVRHLPTESARAAMELAQEAGLIACLYTDHSVTYSDEAGMRHMEQDEVSHGKIAQFGVRLCAGAEALNAAYAEGAYKIFAVAWPGQYESLIRVRDACAKLPGVEMTSSWTNNFEIMPTGVDKGWALAQLAARLGIAREEIVAFGDSENDIPMLRWAGIGVAMGNATDAVKAAADRVTADCQSGGVAQMVRKLLSE